MSLFVLVGFQFVEHVCEIDDVENTNFVFLNFPYDLSEGFDDARRSV